ncbi:hypothetical protein FisN_5Lh444 [Fistulifera solaris]|uniref:FAS1 domain-containing protein n=1 Tax=Fistulifera solaris TaxID=1519565 RepID=A0A1Z5KGA9_FISSO|nr:hypothetical protein FisN_5Lh444 [Fistulifera solaris]|eukprot:GAX25350.1 hypothetical protein FisN_5Lh444 [Fistulifera solaris]
MQRLTFVLLTALGVVCGFTSRAQLLNLPQSWLAMSTEAQGNQNELELFLAERYPSFYQLVMKPNEKVVKTLRKNASFGFTLFVPNEAAFGKLGEKKINQLRDARNLETVSKISDYHTIGDETVPLDVLLGDNIGGVLTMGGEVRVGPSQSGGFFGIGAKDDGGVVIGSNAKIVQSFQFGAGVIHEVDSLVSPEILWRYVDQLRIPGSK